MYISSAIKDRYTKAEFWAITAACTVSILIFTSGALENESQYWYGEKKDLFEEQKLNFGYYKHYFLPHIIRYLSYFICFMWLNFSIVPKLINEEQVKFNYLKLVLSFVALLLVNVFSDYYLKAYLWPELGESRAISYFWQSNLLYTLWLFFAFITYGLFKYGSLLALSFFEENPPKMSFLHPNQLLIWCMLLQVTLVLIFFTNGESFLAWFCTGSALIVMYNLSFYKWIPIALQKTKIVWNYMWRILLFASFASAGTALLIAGLTNNEDFGGGYGFLLWFFMLLIAAPGIWFWYHFQQKRKTNIDILQSKLGQSTAQLDQLRTQINPHFLFNALNTVYGLALTEKAEKTADAIEKISEMMRFMLRENQEAFIPLEKDLDYLKNYMSIQQMRLGNNTQVEININIPEVIDPMLKVAPMLLIPFVENAFKHGISMQPGSFIHLTIQVEGNQLFFNMSNNLQERVWLDDPERNNHGIGLNNVIQRLNLLYTNKHILNITEKDKQYKVMLTILL